MIAMGKSTPIRISVSLRLNCAQLAQRTGIITAIAARQQRLPRTLHNKKRATHLAAVAKKTLPFALRHMFPHKRIDDSTSSLAPLTEQRQRCGPGIVLLATILKIT
jgi:hypothetical protein